MEIKVLGALDCDDDPVDDVEEVLSIFGNSVIFSKCWVGFGDNCKLIGDDEFDNVGDGVKVNSVEVIVGNIVILLETIVGLGVSNLVGALDCVEDPDEELKDDVV